MTGSLVEQRYGKSRVRVLRILREGDTHRIKELDVAVMLSGDFSSSYTSGDNSAVVPTDTIKNTVHALAKEHLGAENERFALTLARHFLAKYSQVRRVEVEARERLWDRLAIDGTPHPHSFSAARSARPFTRVEAMADSQRIESGIEDLLILKSTQSGFAGFPRCEFTTLRETDERIFATALSATWRWSPETEPADFAEANSAILEAMLKPFALNYSPSVQTTLFQMGEAALAACAEITRIHLTMPNKHCLLLDLAPFGLENRNEVFVPTDEPHGLIEATIARA